VDEETVAALWQSEYPRVVRAAYLITGSLDDAEELAQDAFVATLARWRAGEVEDYAVAWVHRVVRNRSISLLRRRQAHERARSIPAESASNEIEIPDPFLMKAIRALPPAQRTALILRYYLDYSVSEAAHILGKRQGTIRALTAQATSRLRQALDDGRGVKEDGDVRP